MICGIFILLISVLDRRVAAELWYWGEVEQEIRETGKKFTFMSDSDRDNFMIAVDQDRRKRPYPHPPEDCAPECKARG